MLYFIITLVYNQKNWFWKDNYAGFEKKMKKECANKRKRARYLCRNLSCDPRTNRNNS